MTKLQSGKMVVRETDSYDRGTPHVLEATDKMLMVRPKGARPGEFAPVSYQEIADLCRRRAGHEIQLSAARTQRKKRAASR